MIDGNDESEDERTEWVRFDADEHSDGGEVFKYFKRSADDVVVGIL